MNQLQDISAGMKGGEVSTRVNGNMYAIKTEIERLESLIKTIQGKLPDTSEVQEDVFQGVSIMALPETSVLATSNQLQTIEVPINVYYGRNKLSYKSYDDGKTCYAVDLGTTNIYNTKKVLLAKIGAKTVNDQLVLLVSVSANVSDIFSYEFEVIFNNVRYKKLIGFNVFESEAQSALNIDFSPSTVIITESYSGGTLEMKDAKCTYSVYLGNNDVTDKVTCSIENGSLNCSGSVDKTNNTISIDSISAVSHDGEGCQLFKWTDINGVQHSQYKATSGYLQLLFTYTSDDGIVYRCLKNFNFAVNYLGTFKESIVNDVHEQVSEKVVSTLTDEGLLLTESARTAIIQSAEDVAISAARESVSGISKTYLEVTAEQFETVNKDIEGNTAQIKSNAKQISLALSGVSGNTTAIELAQGSIDLMVSGLTKTGIDIKEGEINVDAKNFFIKDGDNQIAVFSGNGLTTEVIEASNIQAKEIHVSDEKTGTSVDIWPDGSMNAKKAIFEDCTVTGALNTPFIEMDDFANGKHSSNFNTYRSIIWTSDNKEYPTDCLTWDLTQSGTKIIMSMYAYGGNRIAEGTVTINAKSGMYFFEDGITKTSLNISREMVELIGLSSGTKFYGYVVLRRIDIGTTYRYGHSIKCLGMGTVSYSPNTASPTIDYYTFDKSTISVQAVTNKPGQTTLNFSDGKWIYLARHLFIEVTGNGYVEDDNVKPIVASVYGRTTQTANIITYDPSTNNPVNGSYQFMIYNAGDWATLNGTTSNGW